MQIVTDDLKFYKTTNGLGGPITGTEVVNGTVHNIFSKVEADEALAGSTSYQCVYLKNTHSTLTLLEAVAFLTSNTPSLSTTVAIGLGTSDVGGTEQTIPNSGSAPTGVTFTENLNEVLVKGDVPAGLHFALWLKRVVNPDTGAFLGDGVAISVQGKTEASL